MKVMTVTTVARQFSEVIDSVERDQTEIVLMRNERPVARLIPESPRQNALAVFGDLYRTLDDRTADALTRAIASNRTRRGGRLSDLRDPWAG